MKAFRYHLIIRGRSKGTFFPFIVRIGSPCRRNVAILDYSGGNGDVLSFVLGRRGRKVTSCFRRNSYFSFGGPRRPFTSGITSVIRYSKDLVITYQNKNAPRSPNGVCCLGRGAFLMRGRLDATRCPSFGPAGVNVPTGNSINITCPVLYRGNGICRFSATRKALVPTSGLGCACRRTLSMCGKNFTNGCTLCF